MTEPRNGVGLGRLPLFGTHKMDDGTKRNAHRAAAWGSPGYVWSWQQAAPAAGGAHRMRWSQTMNANALRAYFRTKEEETGCLAYRARMHRLFAELEPSLTVTERNLADRVRYILR
ncbi:unnamed protein product [Parnassius apollo]|uniref:(apollo) hypothetical protein n=1 Tax=Parnassius apollo TaxID=110799 RepID=A0A8S3W7Q0_PARAO|nr:unnamed protein product [Parnassius apollo]